MPRLFSEDMHRVRLFVKGVVQGVGFRPFVYSLAQQFDLSGFVGNNSNGVFIEVQGDVLAVEAFAQRLQAEPPPLAHIESVDITAIDVQEEQAFVIVESETQAGANTLISPDLCICDDCLSEMRDPSDRRYRYPFINCTNCGPRFSIITDIPYDRPNTTMRVFPMCDACLAEYHDPLDRRFHAQPNACPTCGPHVSYLAGETVVTGDEAIDHTITTLASGGIVAIKGIGGFHLACDAANDEAVRLLRERKGRQGKPFALMVQDLAMAESLVHIDQAETRLLTSRERPIVLLCKRDDSYLSPSIAPGNAYLGIMLPYTPLHYLLVDRPLVMTSANYTNEPIIKDNDEALEKLADVADAFLTHDRDIHVHCDDSVIRVFREHESPIRRSRGYAPFPVRLPFDVPELLAVGGEIKSTFCVSKGHHAFMSQHIGDMETLETLEAFERAYEHMRGIFRVEPVTIVCDAHPGYLSSQWAQRKSEEMNIPLIKVQHHHAHIASVMAENQVTEPVIGFSYDGTGYGDDGAIWGGEVMVADYRGYQRISHLPYMPLPGGDAAIKKPYRTALAYLRACGIDWQDDLAPVQYASAVERRVLAKQLDRKINVVETSSMGRLFDVVAALLGVRQEVSYEAQAAIELEALSEETDEVYPFKDLRSLLLALIDDLRTMTFVSEIAGKFHQTIASHIVNVSKRVSEREKISQVVLSGGVFQNMTLLGRTCDLLEQEGFDVFVHRQVPANDGGLALGQAMIASARLQGGI